MRDERLYWNNRNQSRASIRSSFSIPTSYFKSEFLREGAVFFHFAECVEVAVHR